jgi:hypothetical protein
MGIYSQAAMDGVISGQMVSGQNALAVSQAAQWGPNQRAWLMYGSVVAGAAVVGLLVVGRDGVLPGALAGAAGVALFGDVTWTG